MTREDRLVEIDDYVAYLDRLAEEILPEGPAGPDVTVLGFSQGVHTAARWLVYGAVRPRRLVVWGDYLPPDLDMDRAARALEGVELVMVRGSDDPALRDDLEAEERRRLGDAGIDAVEVAYSGGHDIHAATLLKLAEGGTPHSSGGSET